MNNTRHAVSSLPPAKRSTRHNLPGWSIPSGNSRQSDAHVPASWIATAGALKRGAKERAAHVVAYKSGIDGRIGRLRFFAWTMAAGVLYILSLIALSYLAGGGNSNAAFASGLAVFFIILLFLHRILAWSLGWAAMCSLIAVSLMFLLRSSGAGMLLAILLGVVASITFTVVGISVVAKRLHDVNRTGWWILPLFALCFDFGMGTGIVQIILFLLGILFLHLMPGSRGDNEYGPPPPENGTGVIILAVMAILLDVALVAQGIRGVKAVSNQIGSALEEVAPESRP
ncbi:MAG: DUF805 domain-containing protein [Azoarcus sp.]|jgi:uncharacterized membrane protein YhaH (DUF805 family)|nr:DUF805 domain-containing protein [Azoarcus sp.]